MTFSPNKNSDFSSLSDEGVKDLLWDLYEEELEPRELLNIDPDITFGIEIEFEGMKKEDIDDFLMDFSEHSSLKKWFPHREPHLQPDTSESHFPLSRQYGYEVSSPILKDKLKTWKELRECLNIIKKYGDSYERCGGHVHVGYNVLERNKTYWRNFFLLWATYEDVIYRFGYNFKDKLRDCASIFARSMKEEFSKYYLMSLENSDFDIFKVVENNPFLFIKNSGVNLGNINNKKEKQTIEFRNSNGTIDEVVWQNNVLLYTKLLSYAASNWFDYYTVRDEWLSEEENSEHLRDVKALQLADLILDNDLDKSYFLKQYFNHRTSFGEKVKRK